MSHRSQLEASTQQQLLRMASKNLARSVPLLSLACALVAALGWETNNRGFALTVVALGLIVVIWRVVLAKRYLTDTPLNEDSVASAKRTMEANAAVAGLMWVVATLGIYPDLVDANRAAYAVLTCGSIGVAAFFMPLIGNSFRILTIMQMSALIGVSLVNDSSRSWPLVLIATTYGIAMHAGARTYAAMTAQSIRRGLEVEEANSALQLALASAAAANQAKSIFLANMSHEIRTPLTAVIGFSEDLMDVDQPAAQRIEAISTIHRAGRHLLDVINGLLDLSKIEAERLELERVWVPLLPLIEEVAALARMQATDKGLAFNIEHHFPIPIALRTDPLRVRQILLNLIANAIKFTDRGTVTVSVSHCAAAGHLVVAVGDTGIGITGEQQARLFQPFSQADPSISRRFGGTGLGLALSRRLADLLGGTLDMHSEPGVGSCFRLSLPTGPDGAMLEGPQAPQCQPAQVRYGGQPAAVAGTILLAEDNLDNQRLIVRHVARLGATLDIAENGERAIEAVRARRYDLVLMDMQMPVMDGLSAVRLLRAAGYDGAIVALTANATRSDMQSCLEAGCDAFLTKPVERSSLAELVRRFLPPAAADASSAQGAAGGTQALAGDRRSDEQPGGLCCGLPGPTSNTDAVAARADLQDGGAVAAGAQDDHSPITSSLLAEGPDMAGLVDYFVAKLPEYLERVTSAADRMDFGRIGQCAHDLKSVGGGYGYPMLARYADELAAAAAACDPERVVDVSGRLEPLVRRILAGAAPVMAQVHTAVDTRKNVRSANIAESDSA